MSFLLVLSSLCFLMRLTWSKSTWTLSCETREATPPNLRSRLRLAERAQESAYDVAGVYTELSAEEETHSHALSRTQRSRSRRGFLLRNTSKGSIKHDIFAKMSMTVKAYLLGKDDCNKEIRRFAVDQDVSTSFEYLKRKVLDVFVGLGTAPFQMQYKGTSDCIIRVCKHTIIVLSQL